MTIKNLEYDVVIIGAGNAALCAALSAYESGVKILVLEKGEKKKRGGNSFFTDGAIRFAYRGLDAIREIIPLITDEEASKIEMPQYSEVDYYNDLMRVTQNKSEPELAQEIVSKSYETITWMKENGVMFELQYANQSFEKDGKTHFWGGLPVKTENKGVGLIQQLNDQVEKSGIEVWYKSPAVKILKKNNKVSGVIVKQDEKCITIDTKSVVIASGGFEANKSLREKHLGTEWGSAIVRGTEFNTGDGLSMAFEIGAQPYGQWSGCHSIGTDYNAPKVGDFTKPGDIFKKSSFPLGIILNKEGNRFVDEGADYRNYTYAKYGREVLKQPGNIAFQIYDAQVRHFLRDEYNLDVATVYQADTPEGLAELLPVNRKQFVETIKTYNEAVQDKPYNPVEKDGKGTEGILPPKSNWALKIEEGPFYAYPVTCGITFTFGGIQVNKKGEVLDQNKKPIEGLFAAGEMIGGIFYDNYPGGSGLMSGAVFGKISGKSASTYVEKLTNTIRQ